MSPWLIGILVYVGLAVGTAVPILAVLLRGVELHPGGSGFDEATTFSDESRRRLTQHWSRMQGTLGFWKKNAEMYRRLHYYIILWTVPSSVMIPVLIQAISQDPYSRWLVTVVSAFTASLFALHRALRVEEHYKAYRQGESEFYDMYRRMLDRPYSFGGSEQDQVDAYLEQAEQHRRLVRNAEVNMTPSIEQIRADISSESEPTQAP
ncbi:MAG: hypothetical protein AAGD00_04755 [Planctomycetota bacterium]